MKYFVVSDIHSFCKELKASLKTAGFDKYNKDHTLVVVGDVFDRGKETMELYKFLTSIPKKRCILIKGNHEYLYEELLEKSFPDSYDFSNHTVDTFCHIAGYSSEIMTAEYWYKLGDEPYDRIREVWNEIIDTVITSKVTAWIKSKQWRNYFELDKYIFVHSFIPLKNVDGLPCYYVDNRRFEYFKDWRNAATKLEWYDATWGCPYLNYLNGYFKEEAKNGKVLVCGHWVVTDFRKNINNKRYSDDTSIYYWDNLIGLDCGVWKYKYSKDFYHPQNVLVIDDKDFNKITDQCGTELEGETDVPRIETVTPKN